MSELTPDDAKAVADSPFAIPGPTSIKIVVSFLFVMCFGMFLLIMSVDMYRKARTGELRETLLNLGHLVVSVPKVLSRLLAGALYFFYVWFTDLFRKPENKRHRKHDEELSLGRQFDSTAIVARLAAPPSGTGKAAEKRPVGVLELNL